MYRSVRVAGAAAAAVVALAAVPFMAAPAHADTTLSTCDEAAFRAAVAAGGTVRFSTSCQPINLTAAVDVPAGLTVTVDATGFPLTLDGNGATRLFTVTGGHLSLVQVTLTHGAVT